MPLHFITPRTECFKTQWGLTYKQSMLVLLVDSVFCVVSYGMYRYVSLRNPDQPLFFLYTSLFYVFTSLMVTPFLVVRDMRSIPPMAFAVLLLASVGTKVSSFTLVSRHPYASFIAAAGMALVFITGGQVLLTRKRVGTSSLLSLTGVALFSFVISSSAQFPLLLSSIFSLSVALLCVFMQVVCEVTGVNGTAAYVATFTFGSLLVGLYSLFFEHAPVLQSASDWWILLGSLAVLSLSAPWVGESSFVVGPVGSQFVLQISRASSFALDVLLFSTEVSQTELLGTIGVLSCSVLFVLFNRDEPLKEEPHVRVAFSPWKWRGGAPYVLRWATPLVVLPFVYASMAARM